VTGLHAVPFELALTGGTVWSQEKHTTWDCGTTYVKPHQQQCLNPIVGKKAH
jgi:hypothetical protein